VIAVCDAYDAMVSSRVYRKLLSSGEALAELRRCAGTQFDPRVVAAFTALSARDRLAEAARVVEIAACPERVRTMSDA
jgi:HD-GYP domain-containing protein (c-di-GMP phosphodiesterase class II)